MAMDRSARRYTLMRLQTFSVANVHESTLALTSIDPL